MHSLSPLYKPILRGLIGYILDVLVLFSHMSLVSFLISHLAQAVLSVFIHAKISDIHKAVHTLV